MTKEEQKQYLMVKDMELDDPIGELPFTNEDVADEMYLNSGYQTHKKTLEKKLTSDE
jgi:hypothetical protein